MNSGPTKVTANYISSTEKYTVEFGNKRSIFNYHIQF